MEAQITQIEIPTMTIIVFFILLMMPIFIYEINRARKIARGKKFIPYIHKTIELGEEIEDLEIKYLGQYCWHQKNPWVGYLKIKKDENTTYREEVKGVSLPIVIHKIHKLLEEHSPKKKT